MKATRLVVVVIALLSLLGAPPATAKLLCADCGCALLCTTTCTTSTGGTSTCGKSGAICRGKTGCGAEAGPLLDFMGDAALVSCDSRTARDFVLEIAAPVGPQ